MVTTYSTLQDKKPIIAGKLISSSYTNAANARGEGKHKNLSNLIGNFYDLSNREFMTIVKSLLNWNRIDIRGLFPWLKLIKSAYRKFVMPGG